VGLNLIGYAILTVAIPAVSPPKASTSSVKVEPVASGSKAKSKGKGKGKAKDDRVADVVDNELDPYAHLEVLHQERLRHIAQLHLSMERVRELNETIRELQEELDA
jgi:hypothetical protein